MYVLDVVRAVGGHLGQTRHAVGDLVDVLESEVHLALLRRSEGVEDGVGGPTHGHIEGHGVGEGFLGGNRAREYRVIFLAVVALAHVNNGAARLLKEATAEGVGGQGGAVAWQSQAEGFGQAVHGVGGKHAGAGTTGGAGGFLDLSEALVGDGLACRRRDGRNQIRRCMRHAIDDDGFAGLHRAAGDEDGGDVETQRSVEHARGDLVAVGDTHEGVGSMRVSHVLDGIGDNLTRGQGIEHAAVAHGNAIVNGDGVELLGYATRFAHSIGHDVTDVLQMDVTRHELSIGVGNGDDRLAKIGVFGAGGSPEGAGTGCLAANGGDFRAQRVHSYSFSSGCASR